MSILFCSHSDAFDQELRWLFLSDLPVPAPGSSGDLPVSRRHYDFEVIFIHQIQYGSFCRRLHRTRFEFLSESTITYSVVATAVPEPSTWAMMILGFARRWLCYLPTQDCGIVRNDEASLQHHASITTSKVARVIAQSDLFEGGSIFIRERAEWHELFIRELPDFPGGRHDDQVDALVQGLAYQRGQWLRRIIVRATTGYYEREKLLPRPYNQAGQVFGVAR